MEQKLIEIRDDGTTMVCMAIAMNEPANQREEWFLNRAGYNMDYDRCIMLGPLRGGDSRNPWSYDPYERGGRTMREAHFWIIKNWDEIKSGDEVDVEYILGETDVPKTSEQHHVF